MAAMITLAWLNWNAHRVQLSLVRIPMRDQAGNATQNKRNRVRAYAGNGLTTCGTVGVALVMGVAPVVGVALGNRMWLSASGEFMPSMLAT